jgi:RHS repeat-associated protein
VQVIDAKNGVTTTGYDAIGNILSLKDALNNTTSYTYDALDRLLTDTNQLGLSRTYSYDAVGNRIGSIDRNGRKLTYTYDALDRQVSENWLDAGNNNLRTFSYVYDAVGHLLTSTDPDSKYTYTYDAVDRITSIDNTGTVGTPAVKFNYGYDAVGNLVEVRSQESEVRSEDIVTNYQYDLLNRVTTLTQSGNGVQNKRVDMAYNALNQLTNLSRFSNNNAVAQTNYIYDNNQRLIKLSHTKGSNVIASYDYSYDAADKLAQTISSTDGTSKFSYDATNQLTATDHSSQVDEAYSYDANGNRTNSGYQTGGNNQLLSDGKYNYQYDGEGNRTKRTEIATGKVTEYNWDYRNRLTAVAFKDANGMVTKTLEYTYDVDNQRIGKTINGAVTERYVIDRNQIALVFDGAGTQTHRYLYGTNIDQVLADETPTSMVWALADHQGTVRDLIDNGGNVVEHLSYDSFGNLTSTPTFDFRYGYTGRERDDETGLEYYRARYYDSAVGRFISEDPIGFDAGDTNIYRYVGNNAVNAIDPSGLESETLDFEGAKWLFGPIIVLCGIGIQSAGDAFSGIGQILSSPRPSPQPYPLLPFPVPDRNRLHLGDPDIRINNSGVVPPSPPGFNNQPVFPGLNHTGGGQQGYNSWLSPQFMKSGTSGDGTDAHPSSPVGNIGSPMDVKPGTNPSRNIGGRDYSGHALDRMQGRGLTPSVVENTIQSGQVIPGKVSGTTAYYDSTNNVTVITNTTSGKVITAAPGKIKQ